MYYNIPFVTLRVTLWNTALSAVVAQGTAGAVRVPTARTC